MATIITSKGNVEYPTALNGYDVTAKAWQSGDQCRVYFKLDGKDAGFYDCATRRFISSASNEFIGKAVTFTEGASVPAQPAHKPSGFYNTGLGYMGTAADAARGFDGIE